MAVILNDYKAVFSKIKQHINNIWMKLITMETKVGPLPDVYELGALFDEKLDKTGNARTASKLLVPIEIKLEGDTIGVVTSDMSGNIKITTTTDITNHGLVLSQITDLSNLLTNTPNTRLYMSYDNSTKKYALDLRQQRLILTGDMEGYVDINGNDSIIYMEVQIKDDSHKHDLTNILGYSDLFEQFAAKNHAHSLTSANIADFNSKVNEIVLDQIEINEREMFSKEGNRTILKI